MIRARLLLCAVTVMALSTTGNFASAASLSILQFGQSGAQTQVDVNHSYFWNFTYSGSTAYSPIYATFQMKRGPATTENIQMQLFAADPNTGLNTGLLATAILQPNNFTQAYSPVQFVLFNVPTTLPQYFNVTLSSNAVDAQSQAYFIKGDLSTATFKFVDGNGNDLSDYFYNGFGNGNQGGSPTPPTPVPEPASYLAQAGLVLAAGLLRKFRRVKSVA